MASGYGFFGNKGRCYDMWMDFSECMSRCTMPAECSLLREDYFECLHHFKEFRRRYAIEKEKARQEQEAQARSKGHAEQQQQQQH